MKRIRIVIADDHPVVLDGLRFRIEEVGEEFEIVGEAADGRGVLSIASMRNVDVYVLDITMPELNGIETMKELLKLDRSNKVIMLSFHCSQEIVKKALDGGARGYLVKETATRDIVQAIREVHAGRVFLSPAISHYLLAYYLDKHPDPKVRSTTPRLTGKETQVLQLIAEGYTSKEIATKLRIATNTVKGHRTNLMAKLDLHKETELVRYALKEGIAKL